MGRFNDRVAAETTGWLAWTLSSHPLPQPTAPRHEGTGGPGKLAKLRSIEEAAQGFDSHRQTAALCSCLPYPCGDFYYLIITRPTPLSGLIYDCAF